MTDASEYFCSDYMDLGLDLSDESLFEKTTERRLQSDCQSYNLKICNPLWFYDDLTTSDSDGNYAMLKYRADHCYGTGRYEDAFHAYDQCRALLKPGVACCVSRDVEEGRTRCLLRLGRLQEALQSARRQVSSAHNVDQLSGGLSLLVELHRKVDSWLDESLVLRKLLSLHPRVPLLWLRLGELTERCGARERAHSETCKTCVTRQTVESCSKVEARATGDVSCQSTDCCRSDADCELDHSYTVNYRLHNGGWKCCIAEPDKTDQMSLTCYVMSRCLLESVERTVTLFAAAQNERLKSDVDGHLSRLSVSQSLYERCSKFVQKTLNNSDEVSETGDSSTEQYRLTDELLDPNADVQETFDSRWFGWIEHSTQ